MDCRVETHENSSLQKVEGFLTFCWSFINFKQEKKQKSLDVEWYTVYTVYTVYWCVMKTEINHMKSYLKYVCV